MVGVWWLRLGRGPGQATPGLQWPGQEFAFSGSKAKVVEGFYLGSTPCLAATWNGGPLRLQVSTE